MGNDCRCAAQGADPQHGGEHLDRQLETRTDVLRWKRLLYPWEALLLEPANTLTSFFTGNPLRRQQKKVRDTFVRDSNCNSAALTLSRAAQIGHAQALGSCPLHSTENIKNIQILSRTKPELLWDTASSVTLHCLPACLDCSEVQKKILWQYLHELSVKLLLLCDGLVIDTG